MGFSQKITQKHKDRILSYTDPKDRVKASFEVSKEITTNILHEQIKNDYRLIDEAIHNLNIRDPDMAVKKEQLIELKKDVPNRYAIPKAEVFKVQEEINKILGQNTSTITDNVPDRLPADNLSSGVSIQ